MEIGDEFRTITHGMYPYIVNGDFDVDLVLAT